MKVPLVKDWIDGVDVAPGSAVLCENVRFLKGEKKDDEALARKMAALCDIYVMDAFGTAHRAEASTHGVGKYRAHRLRRSVAGTASWKRWAGRSRILRGRWWPSSPVPRSPPSSRCWNPSPRWWTN